MRQPQEAIAVIDHRQADAATALLPQPAVLSSSGWDGIHFERYHQPIFEIADHQHTLHVIAQGLSPTPGEQSIGERWLGGQCQLEQRNAGDIAIIPAGIVHRCNWSAPAQFMVLALEPVVLQQVGRDWVNPDQIELIPRFMTEPDALIQGIFSTLQTEARAGGIAGHALVDSLKTGLAIHLLRTYCVTQPKQSAYPAGSSHATLSGVTDYIHAHLAQNLKLIELAAIAQMSVYHFLRLFKQRYGITPHQYILQHRIERAKSLLQSSSLSLAEIANRTGFCDQSHLTRCFKRSVGLTPKQFLHH